MAITDVQRGDYECGYYLTIDGRDYEFFGGDVAAPEFATCALCGRKEEYDDNGDCLTKLYGCAEFMPGYVCDRCIKAAAR